MSRKGTKRRERRERASAQKAVAWTLDSVDWFRTHDRAYHAELAQELHTRGFVEASSKEQQERLAAAVGKLVFEFDAWDTRSTKESLVALLACATSTPGGGYAFVQPEAPDKEPSESELSDWLEEQEKFEDDVCCYDDMRWQDEVLVGYDIGGPVLFYPPALMVVGPAAGAA